MSLFFPKRPAHPFPSTTPKPSSLTRRREVRGRAFSCALRTCKISSARGRSTSSKVERSSGRAEKRRGRRRLDRLRFNRLDIVTKFHL